MIALVTGSNGFIGRWLVDALLSKGFTVRSVDITDTPPQKGCEHYSFDVSDPDALVSSGALRGVDYVFHLAGITKAATVDQFRQGNVLTTISLMEALEKETPELKRFVYLSSQAAAGPAECVDEPVHEKTPCRPVEGYGNSKLEAERLIAASKIPHTIIRPASVYGPGDPDFGTILDQINSNLALYPANRDKLISYIYVRDLAEGVIAAACSNKSLGRTYFLGNNEYTSWKNIYGKVAKILGKKTIEINVPNWLVIFAGFLGSLGSLITGRASIVNSHKVKLGMPDYWICDSTAAVRDFDFKPRYSLDEGLTEFCEMNSRRPPKKGPRLPKRIKKTSRAKLLLPVALNDR